MNAIVIIGNTVTVNEHATLEHKRREVAAILEDCYIGMYGSEILEQAQEIHAALWAE